MVVLLDGAEGEHAPCVPLVAPLVGLGYSPWLRVVLVAVAQRRLLDSGAL
jgi:hypothetical protein